MSFNLDLTSLLSYLQQNECQAELQRETGQIYSTLKIKNYDIPVFYVIRKETRLLQIIAYLPYEIKKEALGELARLLHIVNKDLDMPGFGLDEEEGFIFYRCVIPCIDNTIDHRLFDMYLAATRLVCETFMNGIGLIASGTVKVDDMLKSKSE